MVMSKNKQFRAKNIRGAKVEDLLIFIDQQLQMSRKRSDDRYYQGMRDALELTKRQLIHDMNYRYAENEKVETRK